MPTTKQKADYIQALSQTSADSSATNRQRYIDSLNSGAPDSVRDRVIARRTNRDRYEQALNGSKEPRRATSAASELSPKQRKFSKSVEKQLRSSSQKARRVGLDVAEAIPEPLHKGFWYVLDQADRARNAVINPFAKALRGEDSFQEVLQNTWDGLTLNERSDFIDVIDEMQPIAKMVDNMIPGQRKIGRAFAGLAGDIVFDPLTYVPGAGLAKAIGKGAKVARLDAVAKAIARGTKLDELWGSTFDRSFRNPVVNVLHDKQIDVMHAYRYDLIKEGGVLAAEIEPMRKLHKGMMTKLIEETDPTKVETFARAVRAKTIDGNSAAYAMNYDTFRNPENVAKLIQIGDNAEFESVLALSKKLGKYRDKAVGMQAAAGKNIPQLGSQLESNGKRLDRLIGKEFARHQRNAQRSARQTIAKQRASIFRQKKTAMKVLGKDRFRALLTTLTDIEKGADRLPIKLGPSPDTIMREAFNATIANMEPGFATRLKRIYKNQAAIPGLEDLAAQNMMKSVGKSKRLKNLTTSYNKNHELLSRVPQWVAHTLTVDAVEQFGRLGKGVKANFFAMVNDPRTASDVMRKFQKEGRPLSFEEVEELIKTQPERLKGEVRLVGPIKKRGLLARVRGEDGTLTDFFETDELAVIENIARQTSHAVSQAEFFADTKRLFGKHVDDISDAERGKWSTLEEVGEGPLAESMPFLKNTAFHNDMIRDLVKSQARFVDPKAAGSVIKLFDAMNHFYVSFSLPLFLGYHTRNKVGNVLNMMDAGYLTSGNVFKDIGTTVDAHALQYWATVGNTQKTKQLSFYIKHLDQTRSGDEMLKIMLRQGVLSEGFFGAHMGDAIGELLSPSWKQGANYHPRRIVQTFLDPKKNPFIQVGKNVGQYVEQSDRATLFLTRLQKGDTIPEAAAATKKFLGDYRNEILTPFERDVMKRGFLFYRWSRFNIPLQMEQMLINRRKRVATMGLLRGQALTQAIGEDVLGGSEVGEDLRAEALPPNVPAWISESAGVPIRRNPNNGKLQMAIMENMIPVADLDNFIPVNPMETSRFVLSQLNPFLQGGIELATGRAIFGDQDLRDRPSGEFLGFSSNQELIHHLRKVRILSELDRMDPFGTFHRSRPDRPASFRALSTAGINIFEVNQEREQLEYNKERLERIQREVGRINRLRAVKKEETKAKEDKTREREKR